MFSKVIVWGWPVVDCRRSMGAVCNNSWFCIQKLEILSYDVRLLGVKRHRLPALCSQNVQSTCLADATNMTIHCNKQETHEKLSLTNALHSYIIDLFQIKLIKHIIILLNNSMIHIWSAGIFECQLPLQKSVAWQWCTDRQLKISNKLPWKDAKSIIQGYKNWFCCQIVAWFPKNLQ